MSLYCVGDYLLQVYAITCAESQRRIKGLLVKQKEDAARRFYAQIEKVSKKELERLSLIELKKKRKGGGLVSPAKPGE